MLSLAFLNQLRSCSGTSCSMFYNGGQLYNFFSLGKEKEEWKEEWRKKQVTAERLAQTFGVSHTADYCNWANFFSSFFAENAYDNYGRTWKANDAGTLKWTILITFQFDVTDNHLVEEFGSSAEWPNRDGRFDWADFRRECTLIDWFTFIWIR